MIKNIVFDMGNVLMHFDPEKLVEKLQVSKEEESILLNHVFYAKEWKMLDEGILEEEDFSELLKERLTPHLQEKAHRLIHHWHDEIEEISGMVEVLAELKEKGYKIYLLSNATKSHGKYWQRMKASEYFDGILVSAHEKLIKPDERIYQRLLERFELKAKESLFIDDLPENVKAARKLGFKGIHFNGNVEDLKRELGDFCD